MIVRLSIVSTVIAGILLCAYVQGNAEEQSVPEFEICHTTECELIAGRILNGMNASVDPCENFHEFMCGTWAMRNPVPPEENFWSVPAKVKEEVDQQLREIVEEVEKPDDSLPLKYVKQWYRSCMDVEALEERGINPINKILNDHGGWPLALEDWTGLPENQTWQQLHSTYRRDFDTNAFYKLNFRADSMNSESVIIAIHQRLPYPMHFSYALLGEDADSDSVGIQLKTIQKVISRFIKANNANISPTQIAMDVFSVFMFAYQLHEIGHGSPEVDEHYYEQMTIAELQEWYDSADNDTVGNATVENNIDWLNTIRHVFDNTSVPIDENTAIEVNDKDALLKLRKLLAHTATRALVNYIHWNLVADFLPYTDRNMSRLLFASKKLTEIEDKPRWKTCLTDMNLQDALAIEFVKKYSDPQATVQVTKMLNEIRENMIQRVSLSKYLSAEAKEFAKTKLSQITELIDHPEWYDHAQDVEHYYDGLTIGPNYFENVINYRKYDLKDTMSMYGKAFNKSGWFQYPTTFNAFYYPQANSIVLPLAQFLGRLFTPPVPAAINYAGIGFVLGHELTHSFMDEGVNYDENGRKIIVPIKATAEENINCFVSQYSNYTLKEGSTANETIHVNGEFTKFENIADCVGMAVVHDVHRKSGQGRKQPPMRLPGLENYTDEQLFFMSFAADGCDTARPKFEEMAYNLDEHAPMKYRIIGVLSNTPAFAEAFNCPANSPMNPDSKCNIV